ncbi:MAG: H4MPT-linked C1 transfer pathway protein [Pirellulaceae bacterium]|nr:H4MPT-linked C1 transfer pathway protein [Pirellulaceae bacterium]
MSWLGIDIGGANLKASDGCRYAQSVPFSLWKEPENLTRELRRLIAEASASDQLAVTMTGELADCFQSKTEGVRFILKAIIQAAGDRETFVYLTDGRSVSPQMAMSTPELAAASNWHALARFAGRYAPDGAALLMDVGSTTCDIIPLLDGQPAAVGRNDTERMLAGELVYTGVERTPLCAVANQVPYRGQWCPIAREFFATMRDVYVVLGELPERPKDTDTADGRPATKNASCARLGRMVCADPEQFDQTDGLVVGQSFADAQVSDVRAAVRQVMDRMPSLPQTVILSGHGEFVARRVLSKSGLQTQVVSLTEHLGPDMSRAATAYALAALAREVIE